MARAAVLNWGEGRPPLSAWAAGKIGRKGRIDVLYAFRTYVQYIHTYMPTYSTGLANVLFRPAPAPRSGRTSLQDTWGERGCVLATRRGACPVLPSSGRPRRGADGQCAVSSCSRAVFPRVQRAKQLGPVPSGNVVMVAVPRDKKPAIGPRTGALADGLWFFSSRLILYSVA